MASRHIHIVLDADLEEKIRARAEHNGITLSAEARDLLRRAVGTVKTAKEAGWWEGFYEAKAEIYRLIGTTMTSAADKALAALTKKRRAA